ncbi:protein MCM10 homolog [Anastrepha ludens]|uniref:protein MCM10 homolog n=1 Tax=Anastrepha ludens TaxID=28586 RepID=UPI0023B1C6BA|nr:protein MCM10 homolog [Anastrepha ludens]
MNESVNEDIGGYDNELLALDALLAGVENEGLKTKGLEKDVVNNIHSNDTDKVEYYLESKFNKYGGNIIQPVSQPSETSGSDLKDFKLSKKGSWLSGPEVSIPTDSIFGLRIMNLQISIALLTERMANRKAVTFKELPKYILKGLSSDWVIAGVILSKETKCTSKTANHFSIWKLSDLQGDIKTISVCLFQNAHDELWKTPTGMCVAILNPSLSEKKNYNREIANLSIDSSKKVLILGKSKDLGVCKTIKKNGEHCKNFVNVSESDFCIFHIEKEYNKNSSIKKNGRLLACSIKSTPRYNTGKLCQRDKRIMDSLNTAIKPLTIIDNTPLTANIAKPVTANVLDQRFNSKIAYSVEAGAKQRLTDLDRIKSFNSSATKSSIQFKGLETNASAMQKAINVLRKCPVEKVNPNSIRGTKEGKKRAMEVLHEMNEPKKRKTEETSKIHLTDILETNSTHKELIDVRQREEEDKYFNRLEKKEAMEEKMLNTYKLPCKAVICKNCKYAAFSAADRCKEERHTLKVIDAVKRFFQCKDCGNRTTSLFKIPKLSCTNCTGSRWEYCAMIRDRKVHDSSKELSVRGDEETFLGATSKININLLLPID